MREKFAILVNTTDSFEDCWLPFFLLFKKYWPDYTGKIYLNTETKDFKYADFNIVSIKNNGHKCTWSECLYKALEFAEEDILLYLQEDYFINGFVDHRKIMELLDCMLESDYSCLHLTDQCTSGPFKFRSNEIWEIEKKAPYRISTQAAFWRSAGLKKYLNINETAWQFETNGTKRSQYFEDRIMCINQELYGVGKHELIPYVFTGIIKGKWNIDIVDVFMKNEIKIDYEKRGFLEKQNVFIRIKNKVQIMLFLKRIVKKVLLWINLLGFDPLKFLLFFRSMPYFISTYFTFKSQMKKSTKEFPIKKIFPILHDRFETSGSMCGHYFHQDLLIARRIFENNPKKHIDIGSRIDGFVAHVASFRNIEIFDIRPQTSSVKNIEFKQVDLMNIADTFFNYSESISCLHVIEHFGLGRYGDKIEVNGHLIGLNNIYKILKDKGRLYISFPFGPQRIEFNAHRVFDLFDIIDYLKSKYNIENFSYVNDNGILHENVQLNDYLITKNYNCFFGLGIFELTKR